MIGSLARTPNLKRQFLLTLAITTVIKVWLAAAIPLTGDEAYFYQWGVHLDWGGYYDHPPMAGWWLWALQQLSSDPLLLRMPAILLWIAVAFGMMDLLQRLQPHAGETRWLVGSLFLALPFTWSLNLITTDIPLILFLFFSGYAFLRGELTDKLGWYAASGVLLGLALFSKYFAGLLAIAYAVYLLPRQSGWLRLLVIALCALPFMLVNLAWNAGHCWNNILFNLMNRNQGSQLSLGHVGVYLVMMAYLVTPWTSWRLLRAGGWRRHWKLAMLFIVPFALFLLLSFYKTIGLHWVLAFLPFVFLYAGLQLDDAMLLRHRRWTLWLGLPHLIALALLAHLPSEHFRSMKIHTDLVLHREGEALITALNEQLPADGVLMTPSYSQSSLLAYHGQRYVPVFGPGSFHARFDDAITDFRQLDGKSIGIASTRRLSEAMVKPYFEQVTIRELTLDGASFWVADGRGFRFQPYFEQIIQPAARRFYQIPDFLPVTGCRFLERYGLDQPPLQN